MQFPVQVLVTEGGEWQEATLTDERAETSCGMAVVIVEGEELARGPAEVVAVDASEVQAFLRRATRAGFAFRVR